MNELENAAPEWMNVSELDRLADNIVSRRRLIDGERALLAGVSGIDASGKGFIASRLVKGLQGRGMRVAGLGVDGWLNLPSIRFDRGRPAACFYERGVRLDEMFVRLIRPLRDNRGIDLEMDYTEETAVTYRRHRFQFSEVDVVLLEGIFIFKNEYRSWFDLACWIDCSFKTAMERAVARGQEGLAPEETIRAFETIYFPAQRIHWQRDAPRHRADVILNNDPRLEVG